jgi:proteic killer suppression protein
MIKTFKHKGLERFFLKGTTAKINASHIKRLRLVIGKLNTSVSINDMDFPGSNLHPLKGEKKGSWAVSISGNWRVTFRFDNENAYDVDYLDYH